MIEVRTSYSFVAQPGDGTRYDLTLVQRSGGGWLVVWDDVGVMGRIRPITGTPFHGALVTAAGRPPTIMVENTFGTGRWNEHTRKMVASLIEQRFAFSGNDLRVREGG